MERKTFKAEATIVTPDLTPPDTRVTLVKPTAASPSLFSVSVTGTDAGGSGLAYFDVYVEIDHGKPGAILKQIAHILAGSAVKGVYTQTLTFQAIVDGTSHDYRFFSHGADRAGNVEAVPSYPADVLLAGQEFDAVSSHPFIDGATEDANPPRHGTPICTSVGCSVGLGELIG